MTPKDNHEDLTDHDLLIRIDVRVQNIEKEFEDYKKEQADKPHGLRLWAQIGGVIIAAQVLISMLAKFVAAYTTAGVKGP